MSLLFNAIPVPELRPLLEDVFMAASAIPVIRFQFVPVNYQEAGVAANWSQSTGLGRENPILQFSSGEQKAITWEIQLWAAHDLDDVNETLQALKQCVAKDSKLKRPFRFNLVWGDIVDEIVVVQSLGNITYNDVRPDGTIRGCRFPITLLVYKTIDITLAAEEDLSLLTDTFYSAVKAGDQWEDIALREYGNPDLGDLLRRRNPSLPFPGQRPGAIVKLPKLVNLIQDVIEPDSPPLRRTAAGLQLRQKVYESRTVSRDSAVILK